MRIITIELVLTAEDEEAYLTTCTELVVEDIVQMACIVNIISDSAPPVTAEKDGGQ